MTSCTAEEIRKKRELYRNLKRQGKIEIVYRFHTCLEKSAIPRIANEIKELIYNHDLVSAKMLLKSLEDEFILLFKTNVTEDSDNTAILFISVDRKLPNNKYDIAICFLKVEEHVNRGALYIGLIDDGHIRKDKDGKYYWVF